MARMLIARRVTGKLLCMRRHAIERPGLGIGLGFGLCPEGARRLQVTGQIGQGPVGCINVEHRRIGGL